ncbi:MAG: serine--tRNA ligase [Polyangiaceae bacterium]|nr:serine--tRNA ligase [Polyangiaceae bacterium]MCE7891998.1 serine--tRNA ligase [Sorangiineae bacterium PRO1]MCL4750503.1 serine--tRNA ligase [Myxococcales bacterium]
MLDGRWVADHLDEARAGLTRRSAETGQLLDDAGPLFLRRRELIGKTESLQARRNAANEEMSKLAKGGDKTAFAARRDELKELSAEIKSLEEQLGAVEREVEEKLLAIPNLPHASTPDGTGSDDNPVRRTWGEKPSFDFDPKPHWDVGAALGILDFERASKLSGARFSVLWGAGARLERALVAFMLDLHTREHGYTEVYPPFLVKGAALRGTGQLPKFEADLFKTFRNDPEDPDALYLIPTAEVPVTNLHADEILDGAKLPLGYTAYTPCFRSEAGSYGKDVRGLIRQHQFDKVEVVRFVAPEQGEAELELLTGHAEAVLQRLGLHYRVVSLCTGDLGFSSTKTYDLEVWLPSQNAYREISSCSWFTDYQARRAKIRYRAEPKGKARFVHTLNGSGLAVGRTLVAILEQFQQKDGSVIIPEALRAFMGTDRLTPS